MLRRRGWMLRSALKEGLKEKAQEFKESGGKIYQEA